MRNTGPSPLLAAGLILACALLAAIPPPAAAGGQPLRVLVFERPPYYERLNNGTIGGFLGNIATEVFRAAGFEPHFEIVPPKRILKIISDNQEPACAVGWFKTPEREAFAVFSDWIYINLPQVLAVRRQDTAVQAQGLPLAKALTLFPRLALKDGFSYGDWADRIIAAHPPAAYRTVSDNTQILRMIAAGRADATIIESEEAGWILARDPELKAAIAVIRIADAPAGNSRHIMCSRSFPADFLERLNRAIPAVRHRASHARELSPVQP